MTPADSDTRRLFEEFVVPNYGRYDVVMVRGVGSRVWDEGGKEYLDFGAGIAVSTLGHAHPRLARGAGPAGERVDPHFESLLHETSGRIGSQTRRDRRLARESLLFQQRRRGE